MYFVDQLFSLIVYCQPIYLLLSDEVCNNYISTVGLLNAIYRWNDFFSDACDFSSSKTW